LDKLEKLKIAHEIMSYLRAPDVFKNISDTFTLLNKLHNDANMLTEKSFSNMTPENLRLFSLALIVEVTEFLQEFNWKEWKRNNKVVYRQKVTAEFADIIAFIGTLIVLLNSAGIHPEELAMAYLSKEAENVNRFMKGY